MTHTQGKTGANFYRALFKGNFSVDIRYYLRPDRELEDSEQVAPILHPTLATTTGTEYSRPPDIVPNKLTGMYEPNAGGTSVFDRPNVLKRADGDFLIPEGTIVPPDLKITKDSFNNRLKATHYTIMPSKPLFKDVLLGQLDNLVRNAIQRQCEIARGQR